MAMALDVLTGWIENRQSHYVCVRDVHGIMQSWDDPALRLIHNNAGMVTPDGMPLVWLSRLYGHKQVQRVYGPDLLLAACARSMKHGWRHFFYGGKAGVADLLSQRLSSRFPGLQVAGTYSPPFRPLSAEEDEEVVNMINAANPDVVWVGLSTPKQERWMHAHVHQLSAPVLLGVGAAFDFHAGLKPQAPPWIQQSGLEWLFRMLTEPRRLGKRYLYNNPRFVGLITLQLLGLLPIKQP